MNQLATADRRAESLGLIDKLVRERTAMLSLYGELAAQHPYIEVGTVSDLLERFCEALIDYTADAHFRLYRFIDEGRERRKEVMDVANKVYGRIAATTQSILDFNDRYDESAHALNIDTLDEDLSRLGEELAERIELEDQIIRAMNRKKN